MYLFWLASIIIRIFFTKRFGFGDSNRRSQKNLYTLLVYDFFFFGESLYWEYLHRNIFIFNRLFKNAKTEFEYKSYPPYRQMTTTRREQYDETIIVCKSFAALPKKTVRVNGIKIFDVREQFLDYVPDGRPTIRPSRANATSNYTIIVIRWIALWWSS